MSHPTAYHQLGQFIVAFQHLEGAVNDLFELLAGGDCEATRILVNDLEYGKRLNTADVLFARFVDIRTNTDPAAKTEFHNLMVELRALGERRNDMVHSRYHRWIDAGGSEGLLRQNSKLRGKAGEREESEEELQPAAFDADLERLAQSAAKLERFRLKVIDWLYPGVDV
ncbi:hypothetical protein [Rhodoferax saidenbachensis]|uniref:Uncharacterized protein n=1 Tax=Rhodoferax saidenbachensis TaxID=1484693 RepID=A0A1P8K784_9BURK|nr:hypothetical protein [Rhodoferax saidenbachensis]APW41821.1 hypothetical protein RS694_04185 [Rhodoferax saidenbachensis]